MRAELYPLSMDLYALSMIQGYLTSRMEDVAVFEFFVREQPPNRNFLVAAGLDPLLDELEQLRFCPAEVESLSSCAPLGRDVLRWLKDFRFTGDVHAMPEGTLCFADEPILRVTAPLPEAQLIEARVINRLQLPTLVASKAVRCVLAAPDRSLVDYGLRRAHGLDAAWQAARASHLAGFDGTSNLDAARQLGIPACGTMAHAFVQACDTEAGAFRRFAQANPDQMVFVLDTYDTESAAHLVVRLAPDIEQCGGRIRGVRIDSGDLAGHARNVRRILDSGGLEDVRIFASGNLDEFALKKLVASRAPIDGFGIGTHLTTSSDVPYLNCAYKLQAYGGRARRKVSEGKASWPAPKQVYRETAGNGEIARDLVAADGEPGPSKGRPLLRHCMAGGQRIGDRPGLDEIRDLVQDQLRTLPLPLRSLETADSHPVVISDGLMRLAAELDAERAGRQTEPPRAAHQAEPGDLSTRRIRGEQEVVR